MTEIERVIAKLESLETERAPSMILDKCDAKLILDHIRQLEHDCEVLFNER